MTHKFYIFLLCFLSMFKLHAQWIPQEVETKANFRAVHTVSPKVCWIGGSQGTFLKTTNSGKYWQVQKVAEADSLDFRDIYAFDEKVAFLMSAGEAEKGKAKIYKTIDGGKTWKIVFATQEKGVFLDGIDFWDKKNGIAFGDPIENKFYILITKDEGESWQRVNPDLLPPIQEGEAAFAASGTSIVTYGKTSAWIGTGGGKVGRVFYTHDQGKSWQVSETPLQAGKSAGIFGLRFWDKNTGIAVGGDYINTKDTAHNVGITYDGGKSWSVITTIAPKGLKEAVSLYKKKILLCVGNGTCYSKDFGKTWTKIDDSVFHAVSFSGNVGFAVSGKGVVSKFDKQFDLK